MARLVGRTAGILSRDGLLKAVLLKASHRRSAQVAKLLLLALLGMSAPRVAAVGGDADKKASPSVRVGLLHPLAGADVPATTRALRRALKKLGALQAIVPTDKLADLSPATIDVVVLDAVGVATLGNAEGATQELVAVLSHPNGWHADTASRLLFERRDPATSILLKTSLVPSLPATAVVRALSLLAYLEQLDADIVHAFLTHTHPRVRERAILLSEPLLNIASLLDSVSQLVKDEDPRVRLQAAFSLGKSDSDTRVEPLTTLLIKGSSDEWIRTAALTSLKDQTWNAFTRLACDENFRATPTAKHVLTEMMSLALRRPDAPVVGKVMVAIQQVETSPALQGDLLLLALQLRSDWRELPELATLSTAIVTAANTRLTDSNAEDGVRIDAIRALRLSTWDAHGAELFQLLNAAESPAVQTAAMRTLAEFSDTAIVDAFLAQWKEFSPSIRNMALSAVLSRTEWSRLLLQAIDNGEISAAVLSPADLSRLADHPDASVSGPANKIIENADTSARQQVVKEYQPALAMLGNADRGAHMFRKTCSVCHKVGNLGYEVGPNLLSTRHRGTEFILLNVLDPNREVLPAWHDYVAVMRDGRTSNGIIAEESPVSVTLRRAEAKESTPLRRELDVLVDTGRSLMPEELEKTISIQQMADLLAWLQAQ